ncbi:MAG: hypothetical protein GF344_19890 [Chitinivibrionales bacterium]|nr:hypothetical protein [Chitinivibrionales bacterium]MBD3358875.1 hypothetical protein [Chitinivibrionales bacterium]
MRIRAEYDKPPIENTGTVKEHEMCDFRVALGTSITSTRSINKAPRNKFMAKRSFSLKVILAAKPDPARRDRAH